MNIYRTTRIPPIVCDSAEFDRTDMEQGALDSDLHLNSDDRNCLVGFAEQDHWFAGIMANFGMLCNTQEGWGLVIGGYEPIQLASYNVLDHFNWHIDTLLLSNAPLDRKITVICMLSDPEEFDGGELELRFKSELCQPVLKKGTLIAFPSFISHRVAPVMQGVRHTATLWLTGPKFR
jgi:PKHD-type hydroxylase